MATFEGRIPAQSVPEAVARVGPSRAEDSFTEALATTLDQHDGLALALMAAAGFKLDAEGLTFEVRTQKAFRVVGQPERLRSTDLQIVAFRGPKIVGRAWCECKLDSRESKEQLDNQYEALQVSTPITRQRRLLAIVRSDADRLRVEATERASKSYRARVLTWLEVNDLVSNLGRQSAGAEWAQRPFGVRTTENWDILAEFLEQFEGRVIRFACRPLSQRDLSALAHINDAMDHAKWLLWMAFRSPQIQPYDRRSEMPPDWHDWDIDGLAVLSATIDVIAPVASSWIDRDGWTRYAAITAGAEGKPAFVEAGVWASADLLHARPAPEKDWVRRLEAAKFTFSPSRSETPRATDSSGSWDQTYDEYEREKAYVAREISLPALLESQESLTGQRDRIAGAIRDALQALQRSGLAPRRRRAPARS
jgi:hypothetical protein